MANNKRFKVKNGLETQNISFIDTSDNEITVSITDDRISFSGDSGQLFSITDSLTGTIFAVNDISGVPSIEVDDDGTIRFAEISGNVLIGTTTDDGTNRLQVAGGVSATDLSVTNTITGSIDTADKWTTARTLSLTGAVTGSASIDGSGNVSLATTATSDPTLTLNGDVSGSATFTNLGNATLTVTVADDSHNHIISNVDGLQTALDTKYQSGDSISVANITATGYLRGPATFTIDPAAHGDNTGTVVIAGNLQVDGTTTTINSTTVEVDDLNITLASGAANAAAANGAGITIDGASATLTYNGTSDYFAFNKEVYVATDRVFHDGYHPNADKWTTARTLTLSGDVSGSASIDGSGNVTLTTTVADDSHNHVISNVDGLQTALDAKVDLAGDTMTGSLNMFERNKITGLSGSVANYPALTFESSEGTHAAKTQTLSGDLIGRIEFNPYTGSSYTSGGRIDFLATESIVSAQRGTEARIYGTKTGESAQSYLQFKDDEVKIKDVAGSFHKVFADNYHPNADKWTTARTLSLTGAVTGSASIDGSGNVSLATTATSDPTLTLAGDATGSATFTNLGNATLTVAVVNDSHTHNTQYYTKTETSAFLHSTTLSDLWTTSSNNIVTFDYNSPTNGPGGWVNGFKSTHGGYLHSYLTNKHRTHDWYFGWRDTNNSTGTWVRAFHDDYHPNADKWTTARTNTVTLTGEVTGTGSASVDGTGNWTVTVNTSAANTYDNYVSWTAMDHDGTSYTVTSGDTLQFKEGSAIDVNFTNDDELTISHADTSSQGSVNNSNGTIIQDVTLDGFGHVTGLASLDGDARWVNVTGDTMTGNLTIDGAKIILESTLDFVSPDTTNTISLNMLDTDTLSFEGNAGQLFSITDSLSGTIFSVNDISGIPSIEVDDDGTIRLAEFSGNILIGTSTASANPYKLQMEGSMEMRGTSPYIRFTEGTTEKGYVQWSSLGYMQIGNDEDGSRLRLKDDLDFTSDNGSNWNSIWHAGNFSTGSDTRNFGALQIGGTTVIDSSRNLTNIGTISSTGAVDFQVAGGSSNVIVRQTGQAFTSGATSLTGLGIRNTGTSGSYTIFEAQTGAGTAFQVRNNGDVRVLRDLMIGSTTVIDSSRNLTNIGTISSGAITSSGTIYGGGSNVSSGYTGIFGETQVGASNGQKLLYFFNDGTTLKVDAYDYSTSSPLSFTLGGNGGDVNIGSSADLKMNGTTVIDSSRNLTNIGTISGFTSTAHTVIRAGNTNAALSFYTADDFAGIGFNRNVTDGAIYDSGTNAFQLQVQGGVFELESYNAAGALQKAQAWAVDTAGNMTAAGNVTSNGSIYADGSVVVNSNASGNYYLYLKRAVGGDGHLLFQEGSSLRWQNTGGTDLSWYSYTAAGYTFQLQGSGGANLIVGDYKINGTTVIDSARAISGTALTVSGSSSYVLDVYSTASYASRISHDVANYNQTFNDAIFLLNTNNTAGNFVSIGLSTNESDGQHHRAQIRASRDGTGTYTGKLEFYTRSDGGGNGKGLTIDSNQNLTLKADPTIQWPSNTLSLKSTGSIGVVKLAGNGTYSTRMDFANAANTATVGQFDPAGGSSFLNGNFNLATGALQIGGTTVIDSSRNLTNIAGLGLSGNITFGDNTTAGRYDIVVGSQTTSRGMLFAPYVTFGTRYSGWDAWIGSNTRTAVGTTGSGIELATSYTTGGASALNQAFAGLNWYSWTAAELSGLSAGSALTLGTPKFSVSQAGNGVFAGTLTASGRAEVDFVQTNSGTLHRVYESSWSAGAQIHDVFYTGWTNSTSDYIYLKTAGNSTAGHGQLIVADNGLFYGQTNAETGGITDSSTAPFDALVAMKVDTAGRMTLGRDGATPQINLIYDDHASGAGWDTSIHIGRSQDLPNGAAAFPTSTPSGAYGIQFQANSDGAFFGMEEYTTGNYRPIINWGDDNADTPFRVMFNGTGQFVFSYNGNFTAAGNVTAYSDIRLKENIEVIPNALEKVQQIRGVTFTRNDQKDTEKRHAGVIAQEVEKVLPEVVEYNEEEDVKTVSYGNMVGLLIEAIKELKAEVEDLKAQLKEK